MNTYFIFPLILIIIFLDGGLAKEYQQESKVILDIREVCGVPVNELLSSLPAKKDSFEIKITNNPKYGREETWTLRNKQELERLELKMLRIEIHQAKVQSVWFQSIPELVKEKDVTTYNLARMNFEMNELTRLSSEYRVRNKNGSIIRILGKSDFYQCFEYHAGH